MKVDRLKKEIASLRWKRKLIEDGLMRIGPMLPYSLIKRYTINGRFVARTHKGKKKGPYYYLTRPVGEKKEFIYVPKGRLYDYLIKCKNYKRCQSALTVERRLNKRILRLLEELKILRIEKLSRP